jgi:hypothetical protein
MGMNEPEHLAPLPSEREKVGMGVRNDGIPLPSLHPHPSLVRVSPTSRFRIPYKIYRGPLMLLSPDNAHSRIQQGPIEGHFALAST